MRSFLESPLWRAGRDAVLAAASGWRECPSPTPPITGRPPGVKKAVWQCSDTGSCVQCRGNAAVLNRACRDDPRLDARFVEIEARRANDRLRPPWSPGG